eukprot:TRINITY_DN20703_c1_g1_i2.p1 TRINITY_DN20703_c1_g1~~TRINITY_DN20703_c1_g1_i2.p1  ORF type:complete len:122 (+),score=18.72 TRINITY_DN20703_c1_g1_i2:114-479(+)
MRVVVVVFVVVSVLVIVVFVFVVVVFLLGALVDNEPKQRSIGVELLTGQGWQQQYSHFLYEFSLLAVNPQSREDLFNRTAGMMLPLLLLLLCFYSSAVLVFCFVLLPLLLLLLLHCCRFCY